MTVLSTPAELASPACSEKPMEVARSGAAWLAWSLAALLFALYATLSIRDQQQMLTTGYDLGIFDEAVRAYAHGHPPIVALKGANANLLGDHFSPIWAILAPVYCLFPTAYTLLIAQAALMAVAVVPLVRWAADQLGARVAVAVGIGYGLSWGIASAAGFDVHEIAFAVPLLAFSATALGQRRWRAAVIWALPLLLVKEDLGFTLAAIGIFIAAQRKRRLGLATMLAGILGSALEMWVLIPLANSQGNYTYTSSLPNPLSEPWAIPEILLHTVTPSTKAVTVLLMLACTGFLALRSPSTLLVLPTLGWRFLSHDHVYWGTNYQYSAVLMPIAFAGLVHTLVRLRTSRQPHAGALARTGLVISLACTVVLLPHYPLWALTSRNVWANNPRTAVARQIIALIPDGVTVSASNWLAPQLTDRDTVFLFGTGTPVDHPAWVIIDTKQRDAFFTDGQVAQAIDQLRAEGYRTVADQAGYLLLKEEGGAR